ncbi:alpha/beta hydrolase [Bradyrhizobium sediminis]|uniref:Alpha/beta hydrolase n=1 Tax=Bradyrhizobium sediminis TaxID=2840469 RepID=A0A975NK02_9BRAD|nr:alpha/beta hydrolase [Bradyrhizobium sediminis]QWG16568.1 alpha/beta hydrolase [Bradyrhizobium sediminis]
MADSAQTYLNLPGGEEADTLLLRRWPGGGDPVLYVHGATFPSALSVGYRFGGLSWADQLHDRGFDVWAFDFAGFGDSTRPAAMNGPAQANPPFGRAPEAAFQIGTVIDHIRKARNGAQVHVVAHSWGTMAAGLFAGDRPEAVGRLVFFGPIAQRRIEGLPSPGQIGAWRDVSVADQLKRFVEDVPPDHPPVLIEPELAQWGPTWLATDPDAGCRTPPAVRIPNGPQADIIAAMSGQLAYDPRRVVAPLLIVRGAWDNLCRDADAASLIDTLGAKEKADVVIPAATHLMHLELGREGLFAAAADWLLRPTA